jgi:hypothetical protein
VTPAAVAVREIPPVLTVADVCAALRISRTQFYANRAALERAGFLLPVRILNDRRPRYSGAALARALSPDGQAAAWRAELRAVVGR